MTRKSIVGSLVLALLLLWSTAALAVELTWFGPPGPLMAEIGEIIAKDYQKQRPDVQIQIVGLGSSTQQKPDVLITQIASGVSPDIVFVRSSDIAWWAVQGFLQPLDNMISAAGFKAEEFVPGSWQSMKFNGQLYALPLVMEPDGLVWAHDTLLNAGYDPSRAPSTWDQLVTMAKSITRTEGGVTTRFGAQMAVGGSVMPSSILILAAQLNLPVADDTKVYLDDPRWQSAIMSTVDLEAAQGGPAAWSSYEKSLGGSRFGSFVGGWAAGTFGFSYNGPAIINQVAQTNANTELGVGPMPVLAGGKQAIAASTWALAIPAGAKNPAEALRFVRYLMSQEQMERWYRYQSSFPAQIGTLRYLVASVIPQLTLPKQRMAFANMAVNVNVAAPPPSPVSQQLIKRLQGVVPRLRQGENPVSVLNEMNVALNNDLAALMQKK